MTRLIKMALYVIVLANCELPELTTTLGSPWEFQENRWEGRFIRENAGPTTQETWSRTTTVSWLGGVRQVQDGLSFAEDASPPQLDEGNAPSTR